MDLNLESKLIGDILTGKILGGFTAWQSFAQGEYLTASLGLLGCIAIETIGIIRGYKAQQTYRKCIIPLIYHELSQLNPISSA